MKSKTLKFSEIQIDHGIQSRVEIDRAAVKRYVQTMREGLWDWKRHELPIVYFDGERYWLASGFHRFEAAKQTRLRAFPCEIRTGTRRDAIFISTRSNRDHGLYRSNEDKRRAVLLILEDEEWRQWSDHKIALHCGVSQPFVSNVRTDNGYQLEGPKTYERNGQIQRMDTSKIGRSEPSHPPQSNGQKPADQGDGNSPAPLLVSDLPLGSNLDHIFPLHVWFVVSDKERRIYRPGFQTPHAAEVWSKDLTDCRMLGSVTLQHVFNAGGDILNYEIIDVPPQFVASDYYVSISSAKFLLIPGFASHAAALAYRIRHSFRGPIFEGKDLIANGMTDELEGWTAVNRIIDTQSIPSPAELEPMPAPAFVDRIDEEIAEKISGPDAEWIPVPGLITSHRDEWAAYLKDDFLYPEDRDGMIIHVCGYEVGAGGSGYRALQAAFPRFKLFTNGKKIIAEQHGHYKPYKLQLYELVTRPVPPVVTEIPPVDLTSTVESAPEPALPKMPDCFEDRQWYVILSGTRQIDPTGYTYDAAKEHARRAGGKERQGRWLRQDLAQGNWKGFTLTTDPRPVPSTEPIAPPADHALTYADINPLLWYATRGDELLVSGYATKDTLQIAYPQPEIGHYQGQELLKKKEDGKKTYTLVREFRVVACPYPFDPAGFYMYDVESRTLFTVRFPDAESGRRDERVNANWFPESGAIIIKTWAWRFYNYTLLSLPGAHSTQAEKDTPRSRWEAAGAAAVNLPKPAEPGEMLTIELKSGKLLEPVWSGQVYFNTLHPSRVITDSDLDRLARIYDAIGELLARKGRLPAQGELTQRQQIPGVALPDAMLRAPSV